MPDIWPSFTKENPCPVCGHWDWVCRAGSFMLICARVESGKPCKGGGWYHHYSQGYKAPNLSAKKTPPPRIDAYSIHRKWDQKTTVEQRQQLSSALGLNLASLHYIQAAYAPEYRAWAFPMKDGAEKTIGIRLRNDAGFKWAVTGSRQGIFLPHFGEDDDYLPFGEDTHPIAYLPEGPTDTAALLSIGLFAIGRPNCLSGHVELKEALSRLSIRRVVIVADFDSIKQFGSKESRPGIDGALKLKKELGLKSVIWIPQSPFKDVRQFLNNGGTREIIENEVNKKVWTK